MNGWETKPDRWEEEPEDLRRQLDLFAEQSNSHEQTIDKYDEIIFDAIFVLAGGLQDNGEVHRWVTNRLDIAYQIYQKQSKRKPKIICIGGGTYHKPPIRNRQDYVVHESTACAEYLVKKGVKACDVYKEWGSYDTVAGGFFAYTNFILPLKLRSFLVVTSEFHMPRTRAIFDWILTLDDELYDVFYQSASNQGIDPEILSVRELKEKNSLENLMTHVMTKIKTVKQLHRWFYEDHKAYCSVSELIRTDETSQQEKNSY